MAKRDPEKLRKAIRRRYGDIARGGDPACCGATKPARRKRASPAEAAARRVGYSAEELESAPTGSNMSLGCGNPQAIAALQCGEVVLDLGSGGGLDCFLAARKVAPAGHVIGVDMTPEMVSKARAFAREDGYTNVEFRLGEIEHLPAGDASVDVVMSNCVVNMSPDKQAVYQEAFRVLKPGGRVAISDVVARGELPEEVKSDQELLCGCVAGAVTVAALTGILRQAGFERIRIRVNDASREFIRDWAPGRGVEKYIVSAMIEARKPKRA